MRWMTVETVIWTVNKKAYIVFLLLGIISIGAKAQQGMNRPYVDDKIIHFGFQIGLNFSTFHVTDSELPIVNPITGETEIYHARVSTLMPGFHVGFVSDVRMCKYLNLRFCPGLLFTNRTISYKTESGHPVRGLAGKHGSTVDVLAMPVYLPLYLKFSASREGNYRPYVIAGGGSGALPRGGSECRPGYRHLRPLLRRIQLPPYEPPAVLYQCLRKRHLRL